MVDIISGRTGPRAEDERARRLIEANRPTIERLADQISGGAWSARRRPKPEEPRPEGLIIHSGRARIPDAPPQPFVRIAVNGRVSLVDANTGKQMHHLGDLRRRDGREAFRLATRENGFFSPVASDIASALSDLDGRDLDGRDRAGGERALIADISARLEI